VQYRFVHHRLQAAGSIAAQVEIRETRNSYDAATSATAATKPHGDLPTTEKVLQLIGQRATSCGQVFSVRGFLHEVQNGRRRTSFPGGCVRHVEKYARIALGMRYCRVRLAGHTLAPEQVIPINNSYDPFLQKGPTSELNLR